MLSLYLLGSRQELFSLFGKNSKLTINSELRGIFISMLAVAAMTCLIVAFVYGPVVEYKQAFLAGGAVTMVFHSHQLNSIFH